MRQFGAIDGVEKLRGGSSHSLFDGDTMLHLNASQWCHAGRALGFGDPSNANSGGNTNKRENFGTCRFVGFAAGFRRCLGGRQHRIDLDFDTGVGDSDQPFVHRCLRSHKRNAVLARGFFVGFCVFQFDLDACRFGFLVLEKERIASCGIVNDTGWLFVDGGGQNGGIVEVQRDFLPAGLEQFDIEEGTYHHHFFFDGGGVFGRDEDHADG